MDPVHEVSKEISELVEYLLDTVTSNQVPIKLEQTPIPAKRNIITGIKGTATKPRREGIDHSHSTAQLSARVSEMSHNGDGDTDEGGDAATQAADILQKIVERGIESRPKRRPLADFSGKKEEDVLDWIEEFTARANSQKWDERTRYTMIPDHLTGMARKWYQNTVQYESDEEKKKLVDTSAKVLEKLKSHYLSSNKEEMLLAKLYSFKQGLMSVKDYLTGLKALCGRFERISNIKLPEKQLFLYAVEGMNPALASEVTKHAPKTFDDLEELAPRLETSLERYELHKHKDVAETIKEAVGESIQSLQKLLINENQKNGNGANRGYSNGKRFIGRTNTNKIEILVIFKIIQTKILHTMATIRTVSIKTTGSDVVHELTRMTPGHVPEARSVTSAERQVMSQHPAGSKMETTRMKERHKPNRRTITIHSGETQEIGR